MAYAKMDYIPNPKPEDARPKGYDYWVPPVKVDESREGESPGFDQRERELEAKESDLERREAEHKKRKPGRPRKA